MDVEVTVYMQRVVAVFHFVLLPTAVIYFEPYDPSIAAYGHLRQKEVSSSQTLS